MGSARSIEFWPLHAADEVMPPSRETPSGFIFEKRGELFLGYPEDDKQATEGERDYVNRKVSAGDIVSFIYCERLGTVDVLVQADGTYEVLGEIPPRATHFFSAGDCDSLADSIEEFARNSLEFAKTAVASLVSEVAGSDGKVFPFKDTCSMAFWSEQLPHKLVHTAEGWRFEQVSRAEARQ